MVLQTPQPIDANSRTIFNYNVLIEQQELNVDNQVVYHGAAIPGSSTASSVWQIAKYVYSSTANGTSDNYTSKIYADNKSTYTHAWSSRATYSYTANI